MNRPSDIPPTAWEILVKASKRDGASLSDLVREYLKVDSASAPGTNSARAEFMRSELASRMGAVRKEAHVEMHGVVQQFHSGAAPRPKHARAGDDLRALIAKGLL